jgi:hypothetical protein
MNYCHDGIYAAFLRYRIAGETTQIEGNCTATEKVVFMKYHKM